MRTQVGTINYYKDFIFQGSNLAETDIFVAKNRKYKRKYKYI